MIQNNRPSKKQAGYSTVEMLIAIFVFSVSLTGVSVIAFGNQSVSVDTQLNGEALSIAQKQADQARVEAGENFYAVNSVAPFACGADSDYTCERQVALSGDGVYKNVKTLVSWDADSRQQGVALSTMAVNMEEVGELAATGKQPASPPAEGESGNDNGSEENGGGENGGGSSYCPAMAQTSPYMSASDGVGAGNGLDVFTDQSTGKTYAYLAAAASTNSGGSTYFYVVDISNLDVTPAVVGRLNFASSDSQTANAVDVAYDAETAKVYAYLAMKSTSAASKAQLQIVDVTDPSAPAKLSGLNLKPGQNNDSAALSVFFRKNLDAGKSYVYLGTENSVGKEFFAIDITDPQSPSVVGSYEVGGNVNNILVRGNYAYLAVSGSLNYEITLDVSNPANVALVSSVADASFAGQSVYFSNGNIYMTSQAPGRLFALNAASPSLGFLSSVSLTSATAADVAAAGNFAYVANGSSSNTLQVVNISNSSALPAPCLNLNLSSASGIVYLNGTAYLSLKSSRGLVAVKFQ